MLPYISVESQLLRVGLHKATDQLYDHRVLRRSMFRQWPRPNVDARVVERRWGFFLACLGIFVGGVLTGRETAPAGLPHETPPESPAVARVPSPPSPAEPKIEGKDCQKEVAAARLRWWIESAQARPGFGAVRKSDQPATIAEIGLDVQAWLHSHAPQAVTGGPHCDEVPCMLEARFPVSDPVELEIGVSSSQGQLDDEDFRLILLRFESFLESKHQGKLNLMPTARLDGSVSLSYWWEPVGLDEQDIEDMGKRALERHEESEIRVLDAWMEAREVVPER